MGTVTQGIRSREPERKAPHRLFLVLSPSPNSHRIAVDCGELRQIESNWGGGDAMQFFGQSYPLQNQRPIVPNRAQSCPIVPNRGAGDSGLWTLDFGLWTLDFGRGFGDC